MDNRDVLGALAEADTSGGSTQTFAAVHPKATKYNGSYLAHCNPQKPGEVTQDDELAKRLQKESQNIATR